MRERRARELACAHCEAALSRPIVAVPDPRLVDADGLDTKVPPGTWAPVPSPVHAGVEKVCGPLVWIHPNDLVAEQVIPSNFGCCGYWPGKGPNLHCRCGAAVGLFADECVGSIEVGLSAAWRDCSGVGLELVDAENVGLRLTRALAALAGQRPARGADSARAETRWDADYPAAPVETPAAVDVAIVSREARVRVELRWADRLRELPLPWMVLAQSLALGRLPIGAQPLSVGWNRLGPDLGVTESWTTIRVGGRIHIVQGLTPELVLDVPADYLELAWLLAADAYLSSV